MIKLRNCKAKLIKNEYKNNSILFGPVYKKRDQFHRENFMVAYFDFYELALRDFLYIQFLFWSVQTWGGDSKYKKVIWKSNWDISDSAVGSGPQVGNVYHIGSHEKRVQIKVWRKFEVLRKEMRGENRTVVMNKKIDLSLKM